jgi:hypothetical protein
MAKTIRDGSWITGYPEVMLRTNFQRRGPEVGLWDVTMSRLIPIRPGITSEGRGEKTHRRSNGENTTIFGDCCITARPALAVFHVCTLRGPEVANE